MGNSAFGTTIALLFVLTGCTTLTPGSGSTSIPHERKQEIKTRPFVISRAEIDGFFDSEPLRKDVRYIMAVQTARANAKSSVDQSLAPINFVVRVSQQRFTEKYLAKNSINIEIIGTVEGEEKPIVQSFYAVNTHKTVESYEDLNRMLKRAMRFTVPRNRYR